MKKIVLIYFLFSITTYVFAQANLQTWKVDDTHSSINFSIKHLGISYVNGKFDNYEGKLKLENEDLNTANFSFIVNTKSINTGNETRDTNLKGTDFFSADQYPIMIFKQTSIKRLHTNKYLLKGDLTIKNITKPVNFTLIYGGKAPLDGYGNEKLGFMATSTINRLDYNISYDNTAAMIAKQVDININMQFTKNNK